MWLTKVAVVPAKLLNHARDRPTSAKAIVSPTTTSFRLADNTTGTQYDRPNGSLIALFYSLQAIANAPMQGVSYSVRSA